MACYLCGNTFTWSTAKRVKKAKGKKKGATAAALPEGRAGSPGGEEEAQARTSLLVRRRSAYTCLPCSDRLTVGCRRVTAAIAMTTARRVAAASSRPRARSAAAS